MQIHTNTWHYRLYRFGFVRENPKVPSETNLCRYIQRIAFGVPARLVKYLGTGLMFACVAAMVLFLGTVMCLMIGVANVFTIGGGFGIVYANSDGMVSGHIPFRIPVAGREVRVAWFWLPLLILAVTVSAIALLTGGALPPGLLTTVGYWLGGIVLVVGAIVAAVAFFTSETWRIVSEYTKARKAGICPDIEIVKA